MNVVMLQTSDAKEYIHILAANGKVNEMYCKIHGISYRPFVGIKRGYYPWQATFNRIMLLSELKNDSEIDWVLYLDADAHVYDVRFPIKNYLDGKDKYCLIIEPGADESRRCDVNAGVFFLNLKHPLGRRLIDKWRKEFSEWMPDERLSWYIYPWWPFHDQDILQKILADDAEILDATLVVGRGLINYPYGRYIRQWSAKGDAEEALAGARALIASNADERHKSVVADMVETNLEKILRQAMRDATSSEPGWDRVMVAERFTNALYRRLLFREPGRDTLAQHVNDLCATGELDFECMFKTLLTSAEFKKEISRFLKRYEIQ